MKKLAPLFSKNRINCLRCFGFFLFIILNGMVAFGQGTVKGVVTDASDNAPLIAVNVVIKGTTIGTVTNYSGEYLLPLRSGTYILQISYMGYESQEKEISIEENQTLQLNFALLPSTIMGEEAVITMQAKGQLAAVNQQLRSNQIVNVVSEERIRELPDENAAQAISRLPGVTLDGSKVVIRGIESKMNKIMINGMEMPATEDNNRATDLGIVSANMLSGIEVYKTLTPDMDADAIGGIVNLRLREAPKSEKFIDSTGTQQRISNFQFNLTTQLGYNYQEEIFGKKLIWGDISKRFFKNEQLGILLNVNYEIREGGEDRVEVGYAEQNSSEIGQGIYMLDVVRAFDRLLLTENIGGSLVVDYDLPGGQIVYTGMLTRSTPDETLFRDEMNIGDDYHRPEINRRKYTSLLLNNSLSLEKQLGIVKLNASIANTSMNREDEFRYDLTFKESESVKPFDQTMIVESAKLRMEPEDVYAVIVDTAWEDFRIWDGHYNPVTYDENQWLADLTIDVPIRFSDKINANLKFGGKYIRKERNYDESFLEYYEANAVIQVNNAMSDWLQEVVGDDYDPDDVKFWFRDFRDYDYSPRGEFMNGSSYYNMNYVIDKELMDEMWLRQIDTDEKTTLLVKNSDVARNDYFGWERKLAGFIMAEIKIGKKLTLIPGVRYEAMHNEYSAYKTYQGSQNLWGIVDTLTKPTDHNNLLPHLHLRYRITNWWDFRFSYNKTLSRPDYNHAIPAVHYNLGSSTANFGNPYIKPAVSENFDANFTFYSKKLGLVTLGGFQKIIKDIFYMQQAITKNIPYQDLIDELPLEQYPSLLQQTTDFYINSPYTAYLKGLEAEWQSNFNWLPRPFNGLVLNVNYTHVWSETKYVQHATITKDTIIGLIRVPLKIEKDTFYVNRLLNQGNDIANISLGYDYKGFSARISFRFQGNVISRIGIRPEENEYTSNIYAYDLVLKQRIPIKSADIEVFLNAINLTNIPNKRYRVYPNKGETMSYTRYTGQQYQLGLRFKL